MLQLTKENIHLIKQSQGLITPDRALFALPEKVLQFGTGVLLRGLPDFFIDKANRSGKFNGRIVVVKSTSTGGTDAFDEQDCLYTLSVRGIDNGKQVDEHIINASISRVLSAADEWRAILACAHNPDMQIIISNTTEVGISYVEEHILNAVPTSFPGKLLAFLYERYQSFKGRIESGMVIIPTELISDNGTILKQIVNRLAVYNALEKQFIDWLNNANHFCNSLVDRIVPGRLSPKEENLIQATLGYTDKLMIMAEPFRLWAIESDSNQVKQVLSFADTDDGVVIAPDIEKFKELKLRLLNGTHTFSCGLANLAGFGTVKAAMANKYMAAYVERLALNEIAGVISSDLIRFEEATAFAYKVFDRFLNPFIDHQWKSIALQFSLKMKMRNIPLIDRYLRSNSEIPEHMTLGFAAFILFMNVKQNSKGEFEGRYNGASYIVQDENAAHFAALWQQNSEHTIANAVAADVDFWGVDLSVHKSFVNAVTVNILSLIENGVVESINRLQLLKQTA